MLSDFRKSETTPFCEFGNALLASGIGEFNGVNQRTERCPLRRTQFTLFLHDKQNVAFSASLIDKLLRYGIIGHEQSKFLLDRSGSQRAPSRLSA
ncbi:MAG: hypothetical protein H7308_18205, partial [Chthonomonadaceae bacterium]|nr:hypothetical protein [Chthonomonadaceae bacterium]